MFYFVLFCGRLTKVIVSHLKASVVKGELLKSAQSLILARIVRPVAHHGRLGIQFLEPEMISGIPVAPTVDTQVDKHRVVFPCFVQDCRNQPKWINSRCLGHQF